MAKRKSKPTKHGKARLTKRMGVSKNRAATITKLAMRKGVPHSGTCGELRNYLNRLYLKHKDIYSGTDFRIYQDFVFIFKRGKLVTSWELPNNYKFRKYIYKKAISGKKPFKDSTDPEGLPTEHEAKSLNLKPKSKSKKNHKPNTVANTLNPPDSDGGGKE